MASTVKSRPNHYEVLGLTPRASIDEIRQAFASHMRLFPPLAMAARINAAYETLGNPARRKAYDAELGLGAEPPARQWSIAAPRWTPLTASAVPVPPTARPAADPVPAAPVQPAVQVDPQVLPAAESRTGSTIAASLRDLARPAAFEPASAPAPRPQPEPRIAPQPAVISERPIHPVMDEPLPEAEEGAIAWKRPAIAVGALVLGVGLFGAWAGWESGNDIQATAPEQAVTIAVPPASASGDEAAPPALVADAKSEAPVRTVVLPVRANPPAPAGRAVPRPIELTAAEEQELAGNQFVESAAAQAGSAAAATEQAATEQAPAQVVAAKMPLPDRVVARTIHRIGYSCGQVASTTALEGGSPGTFKVTCTSGHSYRAQPVRGRYHFRRLGRD